MPQQKDQNPEEEGAGRATVQEAMPVPQVEGRDLEGGGLSVTCRIKFPNCMPVRGVHLKG